MKFCTECGKQSSEDALFCGNCGEHFTQARENETVKEEVVAEKRSSTPMDKRRKVLYSVIGALIVVLMGTHITLQNMYDPMKKIQAMNIAYNNQDQESFFKEFHVGKDVEASAENLFLTVKSYGWSSLRENLTYEVEKVKQKKNPDIIYHDGEFISLQVKPKVFGLYKTIQFTIIPKEVYVQVPYKNMTISFGGKEIMSKDNDEKINLGKFIAGDYDWSYNYEESLIPLSGKGTSTIRNSEDNQSEVEFDWDFSTIYIEADVLDAEVFINDKSTGKTVDEVNELYPAQINEKVQIYAQTEKKDGTIVKSDVVSLESDHIYLHFEHVRNEQELEGHEEMIRNQYKSFRNKYESAILYTNFSYIETFFKEGSKIKQDYAKFVVDHKSIPGYDYNFTLNDITGFTALSDSKFELNSLERFTYSSDTEGPIDYEREKKYIFSYDNGAYFIEEIVDVNTKKTKR